MAWRPNSSAEVEARLGLLKTKAQTPIPRASCDLTVRASINGTTYAGLMQSDGTWRMKAGDPISDATLRNLASASQPLTFTCVPPGANKRVALNLP